VMPISRARRASGILSRTASIPSSFCTSALPV
jgi:hypothetical protein